MRFVFRFAGKSIKKHPEPQSAQGESKDPWFHLNLDEGPHSLPVTGLNRRGISSPRLRDATPINAFHTPQEYHVFPGSSRKNAEKQWKKDALTDVLLFGSISQRCSASESERSSCEQRCSYAADPWQRPCRSPSLQPCKCPRPRCDCLQRQQPRTS